MWRASYSLLLYLLSPVVAARLLWRGRRNPAYLQRWGERFLIGPTPPPGPRLWIHAVSVGEVAAASPLVHALWERFPDHALLVTTTTPTGSAEVRRRFGHRVEHRYLPLDLPHLIAGLVDAVRPRMLLVMETELWPNLFAACHARRVPVMLVNARLSERSLRAYQRVRPLVARTLGAVSALAARSQTDARRFLELGAGAGCVRVSGNLKYDLAPPAITRARAVHEARRPVWIAASTHAGEEETVLAAHREIRARIPGALLILVPRHPERFELVARLCEQVGLPLVRRSRGQTPEAETAVWLGDTMGELPALFALAEVAFMGGSLVRLGGHNPLEAAVHGLPLLTGPHVFNFQEVFETLIEAGGAQVVEDGPALVVQVIALLIDECKCRRWGNAVAQVVIENRGAVERVVDWVDEILSGSARPVARR